MEMNEKIKISLLGKFEIQNGDAKIEETVNRSKKMWNLLGYIITHHDKQISQAEYIEMLWPEDKSSNPINALKTLLSRLRAFLEPIAIHDENFILSSQGSYHWNDKLNYVIDTDLFEMYIKKASNTDCTVEERISLYEQAIALYKGDFLSKHATELWVIPISTYFHNLYIDSVKELLKLLRERNDFDSMEYYCVNALQIERFDEDLHCILIETYLNQGNTNAALAHYEQTTDFLYQNLGVKPSSQLRALYMDIIRTQKTLELDLNIIQNDLKEAEYKLGPFVCEYCIFQETYRILARQAAREGRSVYLCLITVEESNGSIPSLNKLDSTMKRLLEAINQSLRRGDVVSRYSGAQYVILLPSITYEDGTMVMERIIKQYYQSNRKCLLRLKYKLEQLSFE